MSKRQILNFEDVVISDEINPRLALDADAVAEYAQCLEELPPMCVFNVEGRGYVLTRGFHRIEAHKAKGVREAEFIVKSGTIEQAQEDADIDNLRHGVRLTSREKLGVVRRQLKVNPSRTDKEIATKCKASPQTVNEVRQELVSLGEIPHAPMLFNGNGDSGTAEDVVFVDPYRVERSWWQRIEMSNRRRRSSSLMERLMPCQICDHPVSQRAHILDVAAWGPNEHTMRACANCHEIYDILINHLEGKQGRNDYIVAHFEDNPSGCPHFETLRKKAEAMIPVRRTLYEEMLSRHSHFEAHTQAAMKTIQRVKEGSYVFTPEFN